MVTGMMAEKTVTYLRIMDQDISVQQKLMAGHLFI